MGNYAILHIKDRLARINGVGSVQVMGAYAMRIWVKPDRMDYLGVTVADIASAIEQQSEVIPGGQLGAEPNDGSAQFTYTVRMPAQYNTVEQFERIVLRAEPDAASTPDIQYMLAILASRLGDEEQAVTYFLRSVELRESLKFRGNLDPEISRLIRKYGLFREDFE